MIFFVFWVVFVVSAIAAVPIAWYFDNREVKPKIKIAPSKSKEPVQQLIVELKSEDVTKQELEKRMHRIKVMAEGMSVEEMYVHAQATLELATMLFNEGNFDECEAALVILEEQPGIGERYLTRTLAKHCVVLQHLERTEEFNENNELLQTTFASLQESDPEGVEVVMSEMTPAEVDLISTL